MPGSVADRTSPQVIKVLLVDDHPALRDGLEGLLRQEEGLLPRAALPGYEAVAAAIRQQRPHVAIVDHALDRGGGLSLCFRIKQLPDAPGVVLYSAHVDQVFAVPAVLAQADAVVSKTAPVEELLHAVHAVARGERLMPDLEPDAMTAASSRLAVSELPIAGMLFARVPVREIADTLGISVADARGRALKIIGGLQGRHRLESAEPALAVR
jgi:DNA-binding NarL/FixJ family response regulator